MSSSDSAHKANEVGSSQPAAATSSSLDNDVDDLDDLDDVLDEFNKPQPSTSAAGPPKSQPPPPPTASATSTGADASSRAVAAGDDDEIDADGLDDILSQEFAKELAQGMEALMKELGGNPGAAAAAASGSAAGDKGTAGGAADAQLNEEELMRQFEAMMAGFGQPGAGAGAGASSSGSATQAKSGQTTSSSSAQQPANFNDALKATMARLKESDASATASTSSSAADPFAALGGAGGEDMAKLLAALGGEGGEDGMDNPELAKMLEGMMDELMSKEILYEPLKELRDKYPAYLNGPESASDSPEDRARYEQQAKYVSEIVAIFEDPKYDAKDRDMTTKIQDLMNQMQDCGSPPKQIVGDMPSELENIPGFGGNNEECTIM